MIKGLTHSAEHQKPYGLVPTYCSSVLYRQNTIEIKKEVRSTPLYGLSEIANIITESQSRNRMFSKDKKLSYSSQNVSPLPHIDWALIKKLNHLPRYPRAPKNAILISEWVTNAIGEDECYTYPWTKLPCGRPVNHHFMYVFAELLNKHDMLGIDRVTNILAEVFRIMIDFNFNECVLKEVRNVQALDDNVSIKPLIDTVSDCLAFFDKIEKDSNVNIETILVQLISILKVDLIHFWKRKRMLHPEEYWDRMTLTMLNNMKIN